MIRASYNGIKYWNISYPVIDLKFVSNPPKPREKIRPTIVDSGSPVSCLPLDLVGELGLKAAPFGRPATSILGPVTTGCLVGIEINKSPQFFEFGVFPPEAYREFHKPNKLGIDLNKGLDLFALIGTDLFNDLLVAFDHPGKKIFLGEPVKDKTVCRVGRFKKEDSPCRTEGWIGTLEAPREGLRKYR